MKKIGLVALMVILAGCAAPKPVATGTPIPTNTPVPSATSTQTLTPIIPTSTRHRVIGTPTPNPLDPTSTAVAKKFCPAESVLYQPMLFSHSGQYVAVICLLPDTVDISRTLVVRLKDSKVVADISYWKDYLYKNGETRPSDDDIKSFFDYMYLAPVRWSTDDAYVYFDVGTPRSGYAFIGTSTLARVEVLSGKFEVLMHQSFSTYALSPDENVLYSIIQEQSPLYVTWKIISDGRIEKIQLDLKYYYGGDIKISPDGKKVIFQACDKFWSQYTTVLLNVEIKTLDYLMYDFIECEWFSNEMIYCSQYDNKTSGLIYYFIDINTKLLTDAPTPTSKP